MNSITERRQFQRINFVKKAQLFIQDRVLSCELYDVSLKGALLNLKEPFEIKLDETGQLEFDLGDDEHKITMTVQVAHINDTMVGTRCVDIDIDSMSHLRRMVELNTGDSSLLQREFAALLNEADV